MQTSHHTPIPARDTWQQKNVFEAILARRSVRAYTPDILERNTISTLLEAAVHAPTYMHGEPWTFAVVQDRQLLQRLSQHAGPMILEETRRNIAAGTPHAADPLARDEADIFHGAGTLILICAKPGSPGAIADCWLAAENLILAACAMGLGSCVIGSAVTVLNSGPLKIKLGIPPEYDAIAPIVVGIPAGETPATTRKEPRILSWKQRTD